VAHAQAVTQQDSIDFQNPAAQLDNMLVVLYDSSRTWTQTLYGYALRVFYTLAVIQFVVTFGFLLFKQADFAELIAELIRYFLITGFFFALLTYSHSWTSAITDSFTELGYVTLERGKSGPNDVPALEGRALHPGAVFAEGIGLAHRISNKAGGLDGTPNGQVTFYAALTVVLSFVFIAGYMSTALLENWMVINLSVLFAGLGGAEWTRQYAKQPLVHALAVGVKLFVMILLVGLIMSVVGQWKGAIEAALVIPEVSLWTILGLSVLAAFFVKVIPDMVHSLISGTASQAGAASSMENAAHTVVGYPQRYGGGNSQGSGQVSPQGMPPQQFVDTNPSRNSHAGTPFGGPDFEPPISRRNSSPMDQFSPVPVKDPSEVPTMAEVNEKLGIKNYNPPDPRNPQNTNPDDKGKLA